MDDRIKHFQAAVVKNAEWLNAVLRWGSILAGTIVILKLMNKSVFKVGEIEFATDKAWVAFTLTTLIHLFVTFWYLVQSAHLLWLIGSEADCKTAFREMTTTGGEFIRGMANVKRVGRFYVRSWSDPTTVIVHFVALLILPAIIPFDYWNHSYFWYYVVGALLIMIVNWLIGSQWVAALAELDMTRDKAYYHKALKRRDRNDWFVRS